MKIEKKRGWLLVVFEDGEIKNGVKRSVFYKYPKKNLCQRIDYTEDKIYSYDENWEWAKKYIKDLMNKRG